MLRRSWVIVLVVTAIDVLTPRMLRKEYLACRDSLHASSKNGMKRAAAVSLPVQGNLCPCCCHSTCSCGSRMLMDVWTKIGLESPLQARKTYGLNCACYVCACDKRLRCNREDTPSRPVHIPDYVIVPCCNGVD